MHAIQYLTLDDINKIRMKLREMDRNITEGYLNFGNISFIVDFVQSVHEDLNYEQALVHKAAFLFKNIIHAHAFPEGNKRIAFASLVAFLRLNDRDLTVSSREGFDYTLEVYNNNLEEAVVSLWVANHLITR